MLTLDTIVAQLIRVDGVLIVFLSVDDVFSKWCRFLVRTRDALLVLDMSQQSCLGNASYTRWFLVPV